MSKSRSKKLLGISDLDNLVERVKEYLPLLSNEQLDQIAQLASFELMDREERIDEDLDDDDCPF